MTLASLKSPLAGFSGIIFLPLLLVPVILLSQTGARQPGMLAPAEKETSFKADSLILKYTLPDSFLIPGSESVLADTILLHRNHDYVIHYVDGAIVFKTNYLPSTNIRVRYRIFTAPIRKSYFHRQIIMTDTAATQTADSTSSAKPKPNLAPQTTFGAQLRKSGSLTRGITVGTNQGLQVDSGLRMQIAGRLTEKVEVVASLTDQNTPIQPEGNTQTLQEIDKVFVQIKAPHVQTTLGDYNLSFDGTEFTRYNRKLQGAMGQADFKNVSVTLSGAVSRGRFTTNEFLGQEGNQGPYQLRGSEGQISIIVLAGTERVWVDGQPMTRGESNDYVIEYSNGQVTFTRHRLITADSRITVDFQFSDESYQRNLWGAHGETRFLDERFRFRTTFIRESDDKDNPLSRTLSADFVRALEAAGDSAAIVPGFTFVGPDSGNYIDSSGVFVFIGPKAGDYSVAFSFFGENQGDYRNIGLGRFKFVGENRGSYRPFIILPQAQRHDVVGFNLEAAPAKSITFRSELAMSQFDRNLFSPQNDNDNQGAAYALQFDFQPERFALGNLSLGRINLNARIRRKNARFRDIDRTTQVEFNRRWNVTEAASPEETVVEMHGAYLPSAGLTFEGGVGRLSKSSRFESNRWEAQTSFNQPKLPNFRYFIEFIDRHDRNVLQRSTWLRHRGRADFNLKKLKPILEYEGEIRKDADRDTARAGFSFDSYTGGLDFSPFKNVTASARYNYRDDKRRIASVFMPESIARTQSYTWALNNWHAISAAASYTHRTRDFADSSAQDTRTDLADLRLGYSPQHGGIRSNVYYQISNTQVARQEEVFLEVGEGEGNFRFNPNTNEFEPDPFGDFIRQIIATNDFIPVVELRFRTDLRIAPERFFSDSVTKPPKRALLRRILAPWTTETFFRIDERTTEEDVAKIYLLNLNFFQQDSTTQFGSIELRQDVHLWENSRKFSLRYRYRNRAEKNNQLIDGGQDRRVREQRLRLLNQFSPQVSTQLEFIHSEEDRLFQELTREDRKVRAEVMEMDWVYRPSQRVELGMKAQLGLNRDIIPDPATKANLISLAPRTNYSISETGRLRGELEWTKVFVAPKNRIIPFELTGGRRAGSSLRWNLGFDYRFSRNVQASMSYFGRNDPDRPQTQHFLKVEMRAFF